MALPIKYSDPKEYFLDTLHFLQKYSWIYKTSNTCFIKENVLVKLPEEWKLYFQNISYMNLNLFPDNLNKNIPPESIKDFQIVVQSLKPQFTTYANINSNDNNIKFRKINQKKIHEISKLAKVILDKCANQIDIFIDFGCGLGYLIEYLYKVKNDINIIGLEADADRVKAANKRLEQYYPEAKGRINFLEHYIDENSAHFIKQRMKMLYPKIDNPKIGIIGLHSCADLTNISMDIFLNSFEIHKLIIMPCCYHKLKILNQNLNDNRMRFQHFPLSKALKEVVKDFEYVDILNRPFLRLACQQTSTRWREMNEIDHIYHGHEMFIRAVLETIKSEEIVIIKKQKFKTAVEKINDLNANLPLNVVKSIYELRSIESNSTLEWSREHENLIEKLLLDFPNGWKLAEALTCLQTSLQEICENLVLFDRICYMDEISNHKKLSAKSKFHKIFDDSLSPRCFVLIAEKDLAFK